MHSCRNGWGVCERLCTPRSPGPFIDIGQAAGGEVEQLPRRGATPHELIGPLRERLDPGSGTLLVLEDPQWADEGTLDLVKLLARNIDALSALVIVSYRDDQLRPTDPLRIVLGELAGEGVIPGTVRDAVLARAAHLGWAARRLLGAAAVVPARVELWLLEAVAREDLGHLGECLSSGMLHSEGTLLAFRHELARGDRGGDRAARAGCTGGCWRPGWRRRPVRSTGWPTSTISPTTISARPWGLRRLHSRSVAHWVNAARRASRSLIARLLWFLRRAPEAEAAAREAVDVLEALAPGREPAIAYADVDRLAGSRT